MTTDKSSRQNENGGCRHLINNYTRSPNELRVNSDIDPWPLRACSIIQLVGQKRQ